MVTQLWLLLQLDILFKLYYKSQNKSHQGLANIELKKVAINAIFFSFFWD